MKTKITTLILLLCIYSAVHAQLEVLAVPSENVPVIDGVVDDQDPWLEDGWILMEQEVATNSTEDASSSFQILHDDDMIYIVQEIIDATPNNDAGAIANTYARDCNEVFFHMADDSGAGTYTASTSQLRFQRNGDGETGFDGTASIVSALKNDDWFEWMVTTTDEGWTFEAAFPIEVLDGDGTFNGTDFLFEIKATDNTNGEADGRTQQIYYNSPSDDQWQQVASFGFAFLSDTEVQVKTGIKGLDNLKASVFVTKEQLNFRNIEGPISIYNTAGELIKLSNVEGNGSIDISAFNSGLYIVKANQSTLKFIK